MSKQMYEPITDFTTVIQEGDEFRYTGVEPPLEGWMPFKSSVGHSVERSGLINNCPIEARRPIKTPPEYWYVHCGYGSESVATEVEARERCETAAQLGEGPAYYGILKGVCRSQTIWGDE